MPAAVTVMCMEHMHELEFAIPSGLDITGGQTGIVQPWCLCWYSRMLLPFQGACASVEGAVDLEGGLLLACSC